MPLITLTTDFGLSDSFVGQMKGVMISLCPSVQLVDISHSIPPFDVGRAALVLAESVPLFPDGSVHLAVVDPGVGGMRRRIAVEISVFSPVTDSWIRAVLIGPDNGIFTQVLKRGEQICAYELTRTGVLPVFSAGVTFDGRNIFAPVAAYCAAGRPLTEFGPAIEIQSLVSLECTMPEPSVLADYTQGMIVCFDAFGNAATNIDSSRIPPGTSSLYLPRQQVTLRIGRSFESFEPGASGAIINSQGYLEIISNRGSAQRELQLLEADLVELRISGS